MAYNVLKGSVEGSVDQHADQEIGGVKVFKNTISASVFYDTDAQSPCATMKDVAITNLVGTTENSILVYQQDTQARLHHTLTYDGVTLKTRTVAADVFKGSGEGLDNVPASSISGAIDADNINHGPGLCDVRGTLQLNAGNGIRCSEGQAEINVNTSSGLSFKDGKLVIDPSKSTPINSTGQNLSDNDTILVADVSRGTTHSTTLDNLYNRYILNKTPKASGNKTEIQFKGAIGFDSSPKLTFDSKTTILDVEGKINSNVTVVKDKMVCEGSIYKSLTKVDTRNYEVSDNDYTILCDSSKNKISIRLPAPCNNNGRILVIKKADANKYKLTSNIIEVVCDEGRIDLNNTIIIKMNYSSRTLQSDGENWWIVGSKGS